MTMMGESREAGTSPPHFHQHEGSYHAVGKGGRSWRISETLTGWRLEFRDPGDSEATYAGTHATVAQAQREAQR